MTNWRLEWKKSGTSVVILGRNSIGRFALFPDSTFAASYLFSNRYQYF